jgi:hypothetical protein
MNRRHLSIVVAVVAVFAFGWALNRLFELRFSGGDIYPTSSSRRADPLGSKALFQSLATQPGIDVRQNLDRLSLLQGSPESALFVLGIPPQNLDYPGAKQDDNRVLLDFARKGGRLILAIEHESVELATNSTRAAIRRIARISANSTNAPKPLATTLGAGVVLGDVPTNLSVLRLETAPSLPASLPWPSAWHLTNLTPAWTALYGREDRVVAAERSFGQGSIVLLASDYLLSNESLRIAPQPDFIAWVVGPARTIIFDETHLGLSLEPGIAGLILKYRLGGAVFGFFLLAALHVWRSMVRFNPPPEPAITDAVVEGRGSAAGLLNILRRSVPAADIVAVCLLEWRATHPGARHTAQQRLAEAQNCVDLLMELPPRQRNPVDAYRRIAQIFRTR